MARGIVGLEMGDPGQRADGFQRRADFTCFALCVLRQTRAIRGLADVLLIVPFGLVIRKYWPTMMLAISKALPGRLNKLIARGGKS